MGSYENPFGAIFLDAVKRLVETETGEGVDRIVGITSGWTDPVSRRESVMVEYLDKVNYYEKGVTFGGTFADFIMKVTDA